MAFFPLFIDLEGKDVLVVGAGTVGSRRIEALVGFGAFVTVVSLDASETVCRLAEQEKLRLHHMSYERYRQELRGGQRHFSPSFFMVLAATGVRSVDEAVARDGRAAHAFVNVAGEKEKSDFYFPGIVREKGLTAGIIANGTDHRLAKRATKQIGEFLKKVYPDAETSENTNGQGVDAHGQ